MTRFARFLGNWCDNQPRARGQVLSQGVYVNLCNDTNTTICVDVAYVSADVLDQQTDDSTIIDGAPTLAVEILSPSDTNENVNEKIDALLNAGTPLVWIVDPRRRTVTVYRDGEEPVLFNVQQELSGEPQLPGFVVAVQELFV